jgi:hypothetical protein
MRHTAVVVAPSVALGTAAPDVSGTSLGGQHPGRGLWNALRWSLVTWSSTGR